MSQNRIEYLDGLRGIAILAVVFYHAYSRWDEIEPYKQSEVLQNLFVHGWLGVQLFFAISGYVIYMTLLRSKNIFMFGVSRYLRLFPAMLMASVMIYFSSLLIPERPLGVANLVDFIPGLTFVDPIIINKATSLTVKSLDGVFWSLYVEVKFYIISALLYFFLKDENLLGLVFIYLLYLILSAFILFEFDGGLIIPAKSMLDYLGIFHYAWFLAGVYTFKFTRSNSNFDLIVVLIFALIGSFQLLMDKEITFGLVVSIIAVILIFLMPLYMATLRRILSSKILIFFGFISYPLYLLHQNIVTGLAIKTHQSGIDLPSFLYPVPFILLVVALSYGLAKLEPSLKTTLRNLFPNSIRGIEIIRAHPGKS